MQFIYNLSLKFIKKNSANTNNTTTNVAPVNLDQVTSPKDNNNTNHNNTKNLANNRDKVSFILDLNGDIKKSFPRFILCYY